jgi:hypothetical protein
MMPGDNRGKGGDSGYPKKWQGKIKFIANDDQGEAK